MPFDKPKSRTEAILQNILGADNELESPKCRMEELLQSILNNTEYTEPAKCRAEELLLAIKNGGEYNRTPMARDEKILYAILTGGEYTDLPKSRLEELLLMWLEQGAGEEVAYSGTTIALSNVIELLGLKAFGKCAQEGTPTPDAPQDIACNNGVITVKDEELPYGYRRIESIEFAGSTYYETDEKLYGSDFVMMTIALSSSAGQNLFGCYSGTGSDDINFSLYVYGTSSGQAYWRYGTTLYRPTLGGTGKRSISFGAGGTTGFATNVSYSETTFETTSTARIGALPNSSSPKFSGTIYGDVKIASRLKYIPCIRSSDGAIGYYEAIKGKFLEPQGSAPVAGAYDNTHLMPYVITETTKTIVPLKTYDMYSEEGETVMGEIPGSDINYDAIKAGLVCTVTIDNVDYLAGISISNNVFAITKNGSPHIDIVGNLSRRDWADVTITKPEYPDGDVSVSLKITVDDTYSPEVITLGTQTASVVSLLGTADYQDEQDIITGSVTRRAGIKILDGTEDWRASDGDAGLYFLAFAEKKIEKTALVCTSFEYTTAASAQTTHGQCMCGAASRNVYFRNTDCVTLEDWKAWLAAKHATGTPVIIVYPLTEETTEAVTAQPLTFSGSGTASASGSVDDLIIEVKAKVRT